MKPETKWSFDRYQPAVNDREKIYISQIIPAKNSIKVFFKTELESPFILNIREKACGEYKKISAEGCSAFADRLKCDTDYEFFISSNSQNSRIGFARTSSVPGVVVNYLHPDDDKYSFSGRFLCTPCLLKHPQGYLLASMDLYAKDTPQNLTLIFRSDDNGENWYHYSELFPCFWGSLFMHKGDVYMLGISTEYGNIMIGRSSDGGKTFSAPTTLFYGSGNRKYPGWHRSSMPIISSNGRLWTGIDFGAHEAGGHATCILSADENRDLLSPDSWRMSEPLRYNPEWKGAVIGDNRGFIEGNVLLLPDGRLGQILRYSTNKGNPAFGLVPILIANTENAEEMLTFLKFVNFPGNLSKFEIRFDEISKRYYSIVSRITEEKNPGTRNLLSLIASDDLSEWEFICDLQDFRHLDHTKVGFQYVSFLFDGEDIIYLSRTAFGGAESYHNNNYITFHRIENFRKLS